MSNLRNNSNRSMNLFKEVHNYAPRSAVNAMTTKGPNTPVMFYLPDNPPDSMAVMATCYRELEGALGDPKQLVALHLSMMCCITPELLAEAKIALTWMNAVAVVVKLPTGATEMNVGQMAPAKSDAWGYFIYGQAVLVIFKNISYVNYSAFMSKRMSALAALSGYQDPDAEQLYDIPEAVVISTRLGQSDGFKKSLVLTLLTYEADANPFGSVCAYLTSILAWNEMSSLRFINEKLLMTKSPVIRDARVAAEVVNLHEAFSAVCASPHPQFFKIFAGPSQRKLVERSKFPNLIAVAQKLMESNQQSASQLVPVASSNAQLVDQLVTLHEEATNATQDVVLRRRLNFLFSHDAEDLAEGVVREA